MKSQSTALIASSFHCFGSVPRGQLTRIQGGGIRRGRRIPVQATASGRRKYGSKGKAPAPPGRKLKNKVKEYHNQARLVSFFPFGIRQKENDAMT